MLNNESVSIVPSDDGVLHINTNIKAKTLLGRVLSLPFDTGEALVHPILGKFNTVENLWCYLNTGGNNDAIRTLSVHTARRVVKLAMHKYSCDRFRELVVDATILKIRSNRHYEELMVANELPFEHYYLHGPDRIPIRPAHRQLYLSALDECRDIVLGKKEHSFVRFNEMNFKPL